MRHPTSDLRRLLRDPLQARGMTYSTGATATPLAELLRDAVHDAGLSGVAVSERAHGVDVICGDCWTHLRLGVAFTWPGSSQSRCCAWWVDWVRETGAPRDVDHCDRCLTEGSGPDDLAEALAELIVRTMEDA